MVALVRALLQAGTPPTEVQCQQLAGISTGGWIALSLLIGICIGIASTLLVQCYRRRKELRYLSEVPMGQVTVHKQPSAADVAAPAGLDYKQSVPLPSTVIPAAGGTVPLRPPQKYYSPLTKSMSVGPGAMLAMSDSMRNSMRISEAAVGDISMRGPSDQHPPMDVHAHALPGPQGPLVNSYVAPSHQASRLAAASHADTLRTSQQLHHFDPAAYGNRVQAPRPIPAVSPDSSDPDYNTSYQHQLPTSIVHSSMPECLPSPTAEASSESYPAPDARHSNSNAGQPYVNPAHGVTFVEGSNSDVGARYTAAHVSAATAAAAEAGTVQTDAAAVDIEEAYEEHDLDDDWKKLLSDVDSRLSVHGERTMNARERSVAIKKLLVATGSRGVDFAMTAALQEVLQFRRLHQH